VSRLAMDVVGSNADVSKEPAFTEAVAHKVYYGPVYFRRESEPYMTLSLAGTRRDAGVSIAQVNLKLIEDVLAQIKSVGHARAYVVDAQGQVQGCQTKNQLDPSEDRFYVPGDSRQLFEINGVKFGVAICHEGWRYPETVRWAATRGAKIVFHPNLAGSDRKGVCPSAWGSEGAPYYEKAMIMRSIENTIYFASVNYALRFQEAATSLLTPSGRCQAHLPYGEEGVLVQTIDLGEASGLVAARYAPERYRDFRSE